MPNGLKQLLDSTFGPPQEGVKVLKELTTGETSRRLDKLLLRVERLSKDSSAIPQVIELLKLIQEMNRTGVLDKLITLLQSIPKISPRLDKLSNLAKVLLEKEE